MQQARQPSTTPPRSHAPRSCTTHSLQARLDEEQAGLARRAAAFARDRELLTPAEEEEAEAAAEAGGFRVAILERRLQRHEEAALAQYYALDRRLRADPRLAALAGAP